MIRNQDWERKGIYDQIIITEMTRVEYLERIDVFNQIIQSEMTVEEKYEEITDPNAFIQRCKDQLDAAEKEEIEENALDKVTTTSATKNSNMVLDDAEVINKEVTFYLMLPNLTKP